MLGRYFKAHTLLVNWRGGPFIKYRKNPPNSVHLNA